MIRTTKAQSERREASMEQSEIRMRETIAQRFAAGESITDLCEDYQKPIDYVLDSIRDYIRELQALAGEFEE